MMHRDIPKERIFLIPDVQLPLVPPQSVSDAGFIPIKVNMNGLEQVKLCDQGITSAGIRMITCSKCMFATVADQVRMIDIKEGNSEKLQIQARVLQAVTTEDAAYMATDDGRIIKFDLQTKQQLEVLNIDIGHCWPTGMAVHGQYVYVATHKGDLYTLNAQNLVIVNKLQLVDPAAQQTMEPVGLALINEHIYVQCNTGIVTLNTINPIKPQIIDILKAQVNTIYDQALMGANQFFEMTANKKGIYATYNRRFEQDTKALMMVFPFTQDHCPGKPKILQLSNNGQVLAADNNIVVVGDFVHIFARHAGKVQTINIKDIQHPAPVDIELVEQLQIERPASMAAIDGKICFTDRSGNLTMVNNRMDLKKQMDKINQLTHVAKAAIVAHQQVEQEAVKLQRLK